MTASNNLAIRVSPELKAALQERAKAEHRSLNSLVRHYLTQGLAADGQQIGESK